MKARVLLLITEGTRVVVVRRRHVVMGVRPPGSGACGMFGSYFIMPVDIMNVSCQRHARRRMAYATRAHAEGTAIVGAIGEMSPTTNLAHQVL